jgi:hypothetical protein
LCTPNRACMVWRQSGPLQDELSPWPVSVALVRNGTSFSLETRAAGRRRYDESRLLGAAVKRLRSRLQAQLLLGRLCYSEHGAGLTSRSKWHSAPEDPCKRLRCLRAHSRERSRAMSSKVRPRRVSRHLSTAIGRAQLSRVTRSSPVLLSTVLHAESRFVHPGLPRATGKLH